LAVMAPEAVTVKLSATEKKRAPPPAPPKTFWYPLWPPEPHVTGANAEPYSRLSHDEPPPPPQPACPPPPPSFDDTHGPAAEPKPPPSALICPPTESEPPLEKDTLPVHVTVLPDDTVSALPTIKVPDVVVTTAAPETEREFAALTTARAARFTVPPDRTASVTLTAKESEKVKEDPPLTVRARSEIELAGLPSVDDDGESETATEDSVRFVTAPRVPSHVTGDVSVVEGGAHTVDPAAMASDAICVITSGAEESAHSSGSAGSIVTDALVAEAVKAPLAAGRWTSVTFAPREDRLSHP